MKKYLIVITAAIITLNAISCGNKNKNPQAAVNQNTTQRVDNNSAMPANINDLLQNYTGTFRGEIPCADCDGIDMKLTLNNNYTYNLNATYKGRGDGNSFDSNGKWRINSSLDVITLDFDKPEDLTHYKIVDNNTIQMLDKDGNEINSPFNYRLTR